MIPGCFGSADMIFAGHPSDESRAKAAIKAAKNTGATKDDFEKEMLWHLFSNVSARDVFWDLAQKQREALNKKWK